MSQSDSPISPATSLKEGYILNKSYVIERKIGIGGFGITYKAREIASDRPVVIKENFPAGCVYRDSTDGETVHPYPDKVELFDWSMENFKKEASTLINLPYHPNVVRVLAAFYANNTGYIVMKQVKGTNLHKLYPEHSNIPRKSLQSFMTTMLGAISHLHEHGVIHRDIKPENIIITPEGTPVLIDFGAARISTTNRRATQIGTFGYAPPEQIAKTGYNEYPQPNIDLYALGATCYRLITGREPIYNADLLTENKMVRRLYSRSVLATIDKARDPDSLKRWQSAAEWQAELNNAGKNVNPVVSILSMILTFSFFLFITPILDKCEKRKDFDSEQHQASSHIDIEDIKPHIKIYPDMIKDLNPKPTTDPKPPVETPVLAEPTEIDAAVPVPDESDFENPVLVPPETVPSTPVEMPEPSYTGYDIVPTVPRPEIRPNLDESQPGETLKEPPTLPVTELLLNEDSKFYTVKRGDSLSRIARKHKISVLRLMQLNNMTNRQVSKIKVGDKLRVAE